MYLEPWGKAEEELGLAAIQGHVEVARYLLAAGADKNLGPGYKKLQ